MMFFLKKSNRKNKKYQIAILDNNTLNTIHFGHKGYSDYTIHKDDYRKKLYIKRHNTRENWNKSGIVTAGFWSRWLLWNEETLLKSIKSVEKKFNIKITSLI
jgi:hypothetical protein